MENRIGLPGCQISHLCEQGPRAHMHLGLGHQIGRWGLLIGEHQAADRFAIQLTGGQ